MNYFIFGQLITILKNISNKLDMWQDKIQFLIFEIEIVKQYRKIIYSCKNHFSTSFVIVAFHSCNNFQPMFHMCASITFPFWNV